MWVNSIKINFKLNIRFRSGYCHCGICVVNTPQRYKILKPDASFVPKTFIFVPNHVHKKKHFQQGDKLKDVMDKVNK